MKSAVIILKLKEFCHLSAEKPSITTLLIIVRTLHCGDWIMPLWVASAQLTFTLEMLFTLSFFRIPKGVNFFQLEGIYRCCSFVRNISSNVFFWLSHLTFLEIALPYSCPVFNYSLSLFFFSHLVLFHIDLVNLISTSGSKRTWTKQVLGHGWYSRSDNLLYRSLLSLLSLVFPNPEEQRTHCLSNFRRNSKLHLQISFPWCWLYLTGEF